MAFVVDASAAELRRIAEVCRRVPAHAPRDFYEAWVDVLTRYGIEEKVDLVIMCGDFFWRHWILVFGL